MELIKQSGVTAVTEDLTTLVDWMRISSYSSLAIIVENSGGGSANDITDVQIDTSDDNGETVSADQHADTPAVPITAGNARRDDFTETAAYIRVRAKCAAGEDTTSRVLLFAGSATARICTLTDIKNRLGIDHSNYDTALADIIRGIEGVFNNFTGRQLLQTAADVTEYYTGVSQLIELRRYPVISITSIKESWSYAFDDVDALTADSNYRLINGGKYGTVRRFYAPWMRQDDSIQVIYRGGYVPAGDLPGDGEHAIPGDLREVAIEQASFVFKRKDDIGLTAVSFDGGSISKFAAIKLLPQVETILKNYRRITL